METATFKPGGYRYVRGPFQYSGGVAADRGFAIQRARFKSPVAIEEGFSRIEAYLKSMGLPLTSFCACELRSPAPFTEQGFIDFNRVYVGTLERWGIFKDDENPVARSNVCPEVTPPAEPSFQAFSYTVPADNNDGSFLVDPNGTSRLSVLTLTSTFNVPNNALISVNGEPDTWGARLRTTTSTTNLGTQLKNIIWTGGGTSEGFAVSGVGTGGAALEVRNDGIVWGKSSFRAPSNYHDYWYDTGGGFSSDGTHLVCYKYIRNIFSGLNIKMGMVYDKAE